MDDQIVRTLDEDAVTPADRLRLLALYVLFKGGILPADLQKLLFHAQLPPTDANVIRNLELLGARIARQLKEKREPPAPLFPQKAPPPEAEEYGLSRYNPVLQDLLEQHVHGTLPQDIFPFTKMAPDDSSTLQENTPAASLRSAKPTWAKSRLTNVEPRQRVIVFMAGGATYSESRVCYNTTNKTSRDVFLVTSHMMKPSLFLRQVGDLTQQRRTLRLPIDMPPPKAPAHLFEKPEPPKPVAPPPGTRPMGPGGLPSGPRAGGPAPPTGAMGAMNLNAGRAPTPSPSPAPAPAPSGGKHGKEEEKKKKKHHFFSSKR